MSFNFKHRRIAQIFLCGGLGIVAIKLVKYTAPMLHIPLYLFAIIALFLTLWYLAQPFFWRVSRRLTFSYVFIGILPIPLVNILVILAIYLVLGFFLTHQYFMASNSIHRELLLAAQLELEQFNTRVLSFEKGGLLISFAYYQDGNRIAGASDTPSVFPEWLAEYSVPATEGAPYPSVRLLLKSDNSVTIATAVKKETRGVVAYHSGNFNREIFKRSQIESRMFKQKEWRSIFHEHPLIRFILLSVKAHNNPKYWWEVGYYLVKAFMEWRFITWGTPVGDILSFSDGHVIDSDTIILLNGSPVSMYKGVFLQATEGTDITWQTFEKIAIFLIVIYFLAVGFAMRMIYSLSQAVNQMSHATHAVQKGDFSVRIPVRRKDQLGDLQRSFNHMTEHLEELVATAAQKEILESQLQLARRLQLSLIPQQVPATTQVEFATYFEPSAAIGGDYFDILDIDQDTIAIVISDVAGHGVPAAFQMAMLKAALVILIEEYQKPSEILERLDEFMRNQSTRRTCITITLALINLKKGTLYLINAGHIPTYLVRDGVVTEIELPSSPLGGLGRHYMEASHTLQPDDVLVWLSDGLIEITNERGVPFGFEGVVESLSFRASSPSHMRENFLSKIRAFSGQKQAEDDQTLVIMRYSGNSIGKTGEIPL